MSRGDGEINEGYIYFGRGEYLGIVPTRARELVAFHLTKATNLDDYRKSFGSIESFRRRYAEIAPILAGPLQSLDSWDATTVAPGRRMRAERWVTDGLALAGDSALTVNPITSQGVCLALEGGITLATIVRRCFARGDFSARALAPYEAMRRPQAEAVQEIGDYCVWGFGSSNPFVSAMKTRMLRRLNERRDFRQYVMASFCGLHWLTPRRLDLIDGLNYAGLLPNRRSQYGLLEGVG
jgi:2-polyprenyl-6-methoxyphenol hydroxylase-like FAD-dependent oxidoreductase